VFLKRIEAANDNDTKLLISAEEGKSFYKKAVLIHVKSKFTKCHGSKCSLQQFFISSRWVKQFWNILLRSKQTPALIRCKDVLISLTTTS